MNSARYLQRINYTGKQGLTLEVLTRLQQDHLVAVPFENLDIHFKIPIDLANTYTKVVENNRGGFCYELNSLFYLLLKEMGFTVKLVSARVWDKEKGFGPEFDHMAIIASVGRNNYLVDVGFGEFAFHPLEIELNKDMADPRGIFRIEQFDETHLVVKKKNELGEYIPEYIFSQIERRMDEFEEMCKYHQVSPLSHFTQKRICSLPTPGGRISLTGNTLKITSGSRVTETQLANEDQVQQVLKDIFKIPYIPYITPNT